jgi:large subunit ribosomal protein L3
MPTRVRPRFGSLQFWPRKRAKKFLPRVNWDAVKKNSYQGILGFIGYKVGMANSTVIDNTEKSMTAKKRINLPVTILEVPNMKIYSVRFYKNGKVLRDIIVSDEKELKKRVKVSKKTENLNYSEDYDDIKIIVYSLVKKTGMKKTPDMIELGIEAENKMDFVKGLVGKEISLVDFLKEELVDVRGLTKGKGFSGPVKRFGITLKNHKSEKGRRRPGSIGPWHPARVTFRVPMAGQLGMFTRVHYNLKVIDFGSIKEKNINRKEGFKNYGMIKTNYLILKGSVQGPSKRQILITLPLRPTKKMLKNKFELVEIK